MTAAWKLQPLFTLSVVISIRRLGDLCTVKMDMFKILNTMKHDSVYRAAWRFGALSLFKHYIFASYV